MHDRLIIPKAGPARKVPGYEMPEDEGSLLSWDFVSERMESAEYYWINTVYPDGRPHVVPLWAIWHENRVHFDGSPQTAWATNLRANPQIAVHLPDAEKVVVIYGEARMIEDDDLDEQAWDHLDAIYQTKYKVTEGSPYWFVTRMLLFLFVAGMLIPPQVTLIPVVRLLQFMGLMGSFQGLILYLAGGGLLSFAVFIYAGFVKSIPRELDESAIIDGANQFTVFWRIIFPLMRPATATVVIYLSLWTWNEFLLPLIIVGPGKGVTITTGIYTAVGTYTSDYGQIFSMMFLSALPVLLVFFLLQKQFIAGLTAGSLKG